MAKERNKWEELAKQGLAEVLLHVAGRMLQGVYDWATEGKDYLPEEPVARAQKVESAAANEAQKLPSWVTNPRIVDLTRQIKLKPTAELYYQRGNAYSAEYQHDLAIADFNRAIELNPDLADVYCPRGAAYLWSGDTDLAISDLTRAIHFAPNNAEAYYYRGYAHNEAVAFDVATRRGVPVLYRLKWLRMYDRAIEDLTRAIELNPNLAEAYSCRGVSYNKKGKRDCALADFNRAIELNPEDAGVYRDRADVYKKKGMYDHAVADLSRWAELEPENAAPYFLRGSVYYEKGERDLGRADLIRAVDMLPDFAEDALRIDSMLPVRESRPRRR